MITLGNVYWGSGPRIPITFEYEKQRSGADMQYRVKITVGSIPSSTGYFGYPIYWSWTIDGTLVGSYTLKAASPKTWTSSITYTTAWHTVKNKTTGTTSLKARVYSGSGSSRDATYSYSMGVDPAASNIAASNGTLGTSLALTLTRYNSAFTDTITYSCGTATGTVVSGSTASSVNWTTSNGNTAALAAQNTSGTWVNVTFTVTTYNGSTVVGTNSVTITMGFPAIVKPSVSLSVTDSAGYLTVYGAYIQGYSKLRIVATPTLSYGSAIKSYEIKADGGTYTSTPVTTNAVRGTGTLAVTAKVTDNRGRSSDTVTNNITVLSYAKPTITLSAYRCNSSGTADSEGAYMKIVFTSTITSLNAKNSASYKITYPGGTLSGNGTSFTSGVLACDVSSVHNVEVTVTDKLSSTTKAAVVPVAFTLMDYYNTGKGIAFGKVATRDGFDCAMDAYFGNKRLREVASPVENSDAATKGYVYLTTAPATFDTTYPGCYYRYVNGIKEWINPPMIAGTEYGTTERWNGKRVYVKLLTYTNTTAFSGVNTYSINHGISNLDVMISASCTTANYFLPYSTESTHLHIGYWNTSVIQLYCNSSWSAGRQWYFTLKYTKTE